MATRVKYTGTARRYFELSVTGKQGVWQPGQSAEVPDADAVLLVATGSFVYATAAMQGVTASRDLTADDNGAVLRCNSGSTISLNLTTALPPGFSCAVVQQGAGKVTITAGGGVTLNTATASQYSTSGQYATIGVISTAANEYVVSGSTGA